MSSRLLFGRLNYWACVKLHNCSRFVHCGSIKEVVENNGHVIDRKISERFYFDSDSRSKTVFDEALIGDCCYEESDYDLRRRFLENVGLESDRVIDVLRQDGPGFDAKLALDELGIVVSSQLVREVLKRVLKNLNCENKSRSARLGYKFFNWCGRRENYKHTLNAYHLMMKIFSECEELTAMWRLSNEMFENGYPTTSRMFYLLVCTFGEAGMARNLVERFIKSKAFNFRQFKNSHKAILLALLDLNECKLIEWVFQKMMIEGHSLDTLTYNVILCAKYRLGKLDEFHKLLDEMSRNSFLPDLHTYNIILHVLGEANKPHAALNLLNHMKEVGCDPSVLHFTSLIDGLSRAGNRNACQYFFNEMVNRGCVPDVVCYTVMITGHVVAGELEMAQEMFNDMFLRGVLPNVCTYNSMIRGLCAAGKFDEARLMLKEMESRGCNPNFVVYRTLVSYLQNAGKLSEAQEIIEKMGEKRQHFNYLSKFKWYKR
ncbi:hypothetical protein Syun_005909 [Stephania yunnanensis]|uniref:Pentatricopeptide repeat-containing protein n=1 Tax=Stephania yunnanensis TaxID=152371 RepID=A0AAP0KVM9_9MAGN